MIEEADYQAFRPVGNEPLLTLNQITELCWNGWVSYDLSPELQKEVDHLQRKALKHFLTGSMQKLKPDDNEDDTKEGYCNLNDTKEFTTFRRSINSKHTIEALVKAVWPKLATLLHGMLSDLSRASGLPPSAWDCIVKGALTMPFDDCPLSQASSHLRLFRYTGAFEPTEKHSDLGLLTICITQGEGLELLDHRGLAMTWKEASSCTIMVGQALRKLCGEHIRTGVHRVVSNPKGRQSLVFELRPNLTSTVNLRYLGGRGQMNVGDMFKDILASNDSVNARRERPSAAVKLEDRPQKRIKLESEVQDAATVT